MIILKFAKTDVVWEAIVVIVVVKKTDVVVLLVIKVVVELVSVEVEPINEMVV
jgi:hypothetical protein